MKEKKKKKTHTATGRKEEEEKDTYNKKAVESPTFAHCNSRCAPRRQMHTLVPVQPMYLRERNEKNCINLPQLALENKCVSMHMKENV